MNLELIKQLIATSKLDIRPIIALTLRACGLTFREIGEIMDMSKQGVEVMTKKYLTKGQENEQTRLS
jgi:transcriptional regulator